MSCVEASMTPADLERRSDGNSRMLTSLRGQHARLCDPILDAFSTAFDRWFAMHKAFYAQVLPNGSSAEIAAADRAMESAYQHMQRCLDQIEQHAPAGG
jgi:hypothetical protein